MAFADAAGAGWALGPATRLAEARNGAVEDALEARLALGLHHEVCGLAEAAVAEEPFRERRWAALMLALYRAGRQAEALRSYQQARSKLGEELGIEPSPQLARLETDILLQSESLAWAGSAPIVVTSGSEVGDNLSERRTNLPAPLSSFVGRQRELAELDKLIGAHRLVSIVGTGGIGKTRLAIEIARRYLGQTPDGVWFVDLAPVRDANGLAAAAAAALGMRSTSDAPPEQALKGRAGALDALVVFDNCEHLVAEVADLVQGLLQAGTRLRVIATSREALRVPGERVWSAPPLATPEDGDALDVLDLAELDGVRLFIDRAPQLAGAGDLAVTELRLIGELTAKLDGLPLAIELAAARAGQLGLQQLVGLDDRLGMLSTGSRNAHLRHQTLEATIDWSYGLLPPALRMLLRQLSVFAGGFSLEAATAVIPAIGDVAEGVVLLAERSLLDPAPATSSSVGSRYRILESIRQFAAARLLAEEGAGGHDRVRAAHSRFFVDLASRAAGALTGWQQGRWFDALEQEDKNIEAAIDYLLNDPDGDADALQMIVNLDRFWHNRGHLDQCATLLKRAFALADVAVSPDLRCSALQLGAQASFGRDPSVSEARIAECLEIARATGSDYHAASALAIKARMSCRLGNLASGRSLGSEAVELAREAGDPVLLGECLVSYGHATGDDIALCRSVHEEAIQVIRQSGDRTWLASAHNNLGNGLLAHGELTEAGEHFHRAEAIFTEIGAPAMMPMLNRGWVCLRQGGPDEALQLFGSAFRISRRAHQRPEGAYCLLGLACASVVDHHDERGAAFLGFADAELEACGQAWAEPERSYRSEALTDITRHLGTAADNHYDSGRTSDRDEMIAAALELATGRMASASGTVQSANAERLLATILFADIVSSTEQLAAVGDKRWRDILDEFDRTTAREIAIAGGRVVKSTGDGLLATFDAPARAVRCGFALHRAAASVGSELRVGMHTGELERRGDDVAGIAVHIAARILPLAGAGEVLISRTVRDLVAGSGLTLTERGVHHLKGIPDDWQIFSAQP
jgi:predicted ATPase/class 3 adenylate cyclase